jgi:hypothetical protein
MQRNRAPSAIIFSRTDMAAELERRFGSIAFIKLVADASARPPTASIQLGTRIEAKGQKWNWQSLRGTKTLEIILGSLLHCAEIAGLIHGQTTAVAHVLRFAIPCGSGLTSWNRRTPVSDSRRVAASLTSDGPRSRTVPCDFPRALA